MTCQTYPTFILILPDLFMRIYGFKVQGFIFDKLALPHTQS
jgi:hypothetical protein